MLETVELSKLEIVLYFYFLGIVFIYLGEIFYSFLINKNENKSHSFRYSFLPIFGIFITSNFLVIWNFFSGTADNFILFLFLILFLVSLRSNPSLIKNYIFYFINLTILFLSSTTVGISKDANLYHLQQQSWLRDEKMVLGISNINPYLGYSSIIEYINSTLWFENNYIFIHFIGIYIIASIFDLFFKFLKSNNSSYKNFAFLFLTIGILDNFGFEGGRNGFLFIQEIFKYDHIFAALTLFFISYFFITFKESPNAENLNVLIFIFLFSAQTRFVGHLLLIYFFVLLYKNKYQMKGRKLFAPLFFYLIFVMKNILSSTCLWFPIQLTCLSILPFYQPSQAEYISKLLLNVNKIPNSNAKTNISTVEFLENFVSTQSSYLLNFLITCLIAIIFFSVFRKKIAINFSQIVLSILIFSIWLFSAPTYRFGVPFFLSIYFVLFFRYIIETKINIPRYLKSLPNFLLLFVVLTLVRFDSILALQNFDSIELKIGKEVISFIDIEDGWKKYSQPHTVNNYLCGDIKLCYVEEFYSSKVELSFNYYYFIPNNKYYFVEELENND